MIALLLKKLNFEKIIFSSKILSQNIDITLKTSFISNCFVLMIIFLYLLTAIYSIGYLNFEQDKRKIRFHILMFVSSLTTICLAYSNNLFTAFIFYDLLSVFTYMLVKHHGDENSERKSLLYAFYLLLPSMILLLPAIILIYIITGHTNFSPNGILINIPLSKQFVNILFLLFMYGISKIAIYPLHRWLIYAMVAPSPVSALLHAVLVVKGGLFFLYKVIVEIFGLEFLQQNIYTIYGIYWPVYVAGISIIISAISSISSENIKQRLAYSTISQIGYISMCFFCFTESSILAGQLQFLAHSLAKISLFYYAGYLLARYHVAHISELKFTRNKFSIFWSILWIIPIISLMSMPLTIGYIGKHFIISSIANRFIIISILITGMILCCLYLYPLLLHLMTFNNQNKRFPVFDQLFSKICIYVPVLIVSCLNVYLYFLIYKMI